MAKILSYKTNDLTNWYVEPMTYSFLDWLESLASIKRGKRTLTNGTWASFLGDDRPIMAVVKFEKLIDYFVAPMVILLKNKANKPGVDPCLPDPLPNSGESIN